MSIENFSHWCSKLQQFIQAKRWRSLMVLVGDEHWTAQHIQATLTLFLSTQARAESTQNQGLIYGEVANLGHYPQLMPVNGKNYAQCLGTEQKLIVFNAQTASKSNDFDVDAFAALSGTVVAGGVFLLIISPSQVQQLGDGETKDYFLQRFWRQLVSENCYLIRQEHTLLPALPLDYQAAESLALDVSNETLANAKQFVSFPYGCVTAEQVLAVEAMLKVLSGHRDRPLVLTADRGRGKSSALALAACQMLNKATQSLTIIITASSKAALKVFFKQVEQHLPSAAINANCIEHAQGRIVFYPLDVLLKQRPQASIVMVDEAAALPVYLLQPLLGYYHRLIFATTIHGYEGAGRGFTIKFRQVLQRVMPQWRTMHIKEAIRWASKDPLEQFVFSSCLLNAKLPKYDQTVIAKNNFAMTVNKEQKLQQAGFSVELVSAVQLLKNEMFLQQVFAVLVTAHYQTSPSDVKLLLNNPAISLLVLKRQDDILGVALLMREGHVDEHLVATIRENQRRLRDQFLPQSLLTHCGIKESFNYRYQRVMRIAIHPQFQGLGLGAYFLTTIEKTITAQGIDYIGASFAANATLLKFWQQADFNIARVGFNKDKASGEHSCLVIKALNGKAAKLQQGITEQFYQQFDYWLSDEFKYLPVKLVWQILNANAAIKVIALSNNTEQSVNDFVSAQRQFSSCVYGLHQWLLKHCTEDFDSEILPLLARILQKHSIEQVCQQFGFTGKKALNQHLISYIAKYQKQNTEHQTH